MCLVCPEHAPYAWHSEDLSRSGSEESTFKGLDQELLRGDRAPLGWAFRVCICVFSCLSTACFFKTHPVHSCFTKLYLSTCLSHIFCHSTSSLTQRIAQLFMPVTQLRDPPAVGSRPPCPTEPLARWRAFNFLPMRRGTGRSRFLGAPTLSNYRTQGKKWINVLNLPSGK